MSKGTKQKYKQFSINNIQDACIVLGSLISAIIINIEKYKEYSAEALSLLLSTKENRIQAKCYDDINDKLLYRQREMLKFVADHQSSSFSYIDLRPMLEKRGYLKKPLDEETDKTLQELLAIRNWSFHNPQSLLVAAKEVAEKRIPKELQGIAEVMPPINPVFVRKVTYYERIMLESLILHTEKIIEQFEHILSCMKEDYQDLFDSLDDKPLIMTHNGLSQKVQYIEQNVVIGVSDFYSDVSQISMSIQKSKYNGTEEEFDKWVIRNRCEDEPSHEKEKPK